MEVKGLRLRNDCFALLLFFVISSLLNVANGSEVDEHASQGSFKYPSNQAQIAKLLKNYRKKGYLEKLKTDSERYARNIISWQMDHGGFGLHDAKAYEQPWDGQTKRSVWVSKGRELGNFDDNATVAEIRFLADVYASTSDPKLKSSIKLSIQRALQFIFRAQYGNGGWPQVYPHRYKTTYSNNVTLNDNAMIRTMVLLSDILANVSPFDNDLVDSDMKKDIFPRLQLAVDYLLKVQIKNDNRLTIWSSQYDKITNEPASARSYEHPSKSTRESVGVLVFLMNWPDQNEKIVNAVSGGLSWFKQNKVLDLAFHKGRFFEKKGAELWYRFYEVETNVPFFCGRDGVKKYDLALVEEERRKNYSWANNYATKIIHLVPRYFKSVLPNERAYQ